VVVQIVMYFWSECVYMCGSQGVVSQSIESGHQCVKGDTSSQNTEHVLTRTLTCTVHLTVHHNSTCVMALLLISHRLSDSKPLPYTVLVVLFWNCDIIVYIKGWKGLVH